MQLLLLVHVVACSGASVPYRSGLHTCCQPCESARPPGALGRLQERILRTGGQYEGLPLAAALALTTAADFGEVMLEVGIIFTGGAPRGWP